MENIELVKVLNELDDAINWLKSLEKDADFRFQSELISNYMKDKSEYDCQKKIAERTTPTKMSDELVFTLYFGKNYEGTFTDDFFKFKDYGFCERNNIKFKWYEIDDIIFRFETVLKLLKNKKITLNWKPNC